MTDVFSSKKRSDIMRAVKGVDTKPEMRVRRLLHALGYRYRLHLKILPGSPDLVFPKIRKVVFIHGCFWHRHSCVEGRSMPKSNSSYWNAKFKANKQRDALHRRHLRKHGWAVLTIWECQTLPQLQHNLQDRLVSFLR